MEDCRTPQKVLGYPVASVQQFYKKESPAKFKLINNHIKAQLNPQKNYGKLPMSNLATQTPDKSNEFMLTPGRKCSLSSTAKSFHVFPLNNTPPSENKTKNKVVNPFEAALTDRLHLPLICSPSLFHRPSTPHCSLSTNFEWTIEEVSSIGPANVEPHETQFHDSLDPEIEAKTQAAISSFFKEQQIVPSPVGCPLRNQRIILAKTSVGVSPGIRRAKRIKDGIAQTILTLPPILPPGIEEALKPYFNFFENQQQSPTINCDKNDSLKAYHEARDASLRRKLFALPHDMPHDDTLDGDYDEGEILENSVFSSPPPKSPDLVEDEINTSKKNPFEKSSEDKPFEKSSFGSLSPISKLSNESPNPKRFSGERCFLNNLESEIISPIKAASSPNITILQSKINSTSLDQLKSSTQNIFDNSFNDSRLYRSTPDHSMHLVNSCENPSENNNMSVESNFNCKISRILVDRSSRPNEIKTYNISKSKSMTEVDIFNANEYDEDDMQVSQLSEKSSNSLNSSNSDTPRRSKKRLNRKNLSRSFSSQLSDDDDEINIANISKDIIQIIDNVQKSRNSIQNIKDVSSEKTNLKPYENSVFYRVDSGFNEMTNTQDDTKFVQILKNSITPKKQYSTIIDENAINITLANEDISMISCSTPSKVF